MFYTYVEKFGKRIYHRYVDENGKRREQVVEEFPIELYVPGVRRDGTALDGRTLSRLDFPTVQGASEFLRSNQAEALDIYGNTDLASQFIAKCYPGEIEYDASKFVILNFDIEVEHDNGFPHAHIAANEVQSITMKVFGRDKFITLGLKDYTPKRPQDIYVKCNNEAHLLNAFIGFFKTIKPDIITGWNIVGFDIPYLVNRMRRILGTGEADKLSPFSAWTKRTITEAKIKNARGDDAQTYRILGVTALDYLEIYKKFSPDKLESYKLDFVGEHEEVGRKFDLTQWGGNLMRLYREDFDSFIEYNAQDVYLVELLDRKLQFMSLAASIAYMTHSRHRDILGTTKIWDNLIYNMLLEDGIQIPPLKERRERGEFVGGYVKEPKPGLYRWVVSLDFSSLYPTIIRMFNMSPETLVDRSVGKEFAERLLAKEAVTGDALERGLSIVGNGTTYRQGSPGVIPRAMTYVFNERKRIKNEMLKVEGMVQETSGKKGKEELRTQVVMLDAKQKAVKVVANGGYGATATESFRYYDLNIAEGITTTGQIFNKFAQEVINDILNKASGTDGVDYIFMGDTDSVYFSLETWVKKQGLEGESKEKTVDAIDRFVQNELETRLNRAFKEFGCDYLGAKENLMDMKREAIADVCVVRGKKNYIINVLDNEGVRYSQPKLKVIGLESVRSSTPGIVREELVESYKLVAQGGTEAQLQERVRNFAAAWKEQPLWKVAFPRGVSEIEKWRTHDGMVYKKGTPIHCKASIFYNDMVNKDPELSRTYPLIKEGGKIRFIYLKQPNHARASVIAFPEETLPPEFGLNDYIDFDTQYEKAYLNPLRSIVSLVGWSTEKKATLW